MASLRLERATDARGITLIRAARLAEPTELRFRTTQCLATRSNPCPDVRQDAPGRPVLRRRSNPTDIPRHTEPRSAPHPVAARCFGILTTVIRLHRRRSTPNHTALRCIDNHHPLPSATAVNAESRGAVRRLCSIQGGIEIHWGNRSWETPRCDAALSRLGL